MANAYFVPSALALVFSFAGLVLGSLTGWLGGKLVYRLGVAHDKGANLNAPCSLSGQPTQGSYTGNERRLREMRTGVMTTH